MKMNFLRIIIFTAILLIAGRTVNAQTTNRPDAIGRQVFAVLKTLSNSNGDKLSAYFLKKEDGENLYSALKYKAAQNGVSNWNKIEYIDYIHKEFQKNGAKYSSGFLAVKLNGDKDYTYFGIYLLNIQIGSSYKVLQCNDNWSRDTTIPWDRIRKSLDEIQGKWLN
jgi:hypothetical protein